MGARRLCDNRKSITESGGIGPLVALLGCDNPRAREHAEGALVRLSIENENRVLIIEQLVDALSDGSVESARKRAEEHVKAFQSKIEGKKRDIEEQTSKGADGAVRRAQAELEKLEAALKGVEETAREAQGRADVVLAAQEQAAAALNLARDSVENRVSIVSAGGIRRCSS